MEFLRCILSLTLLGAIGYTESLNLKGESSGSCGKMRNITCQVDSASPVPNTLSWLKDSTIVTQCDHAGGTITCLDTVLQNKYFTTDITKKEYYITFNTTKLTDAGTWGCSVGSTTSELNITVETLPEASPQPSTSGTLKLETNCLPSLPSSLKVDWFYEDPDLSKEFKLEPIQEKPVTNAVVPCAPGDCSVNGYKKFNAEATFKQGPCTLKVVAYPSDDSFLPVHFPGACVEGDIFNTTTHMATPPTTQPSNSTATTSHESTSPTSGNLTCDFGTVQAIIGGSVGGYVLVISLTPLVSCICLASGR